jgi:hypothetical protein
MKPSQIPSVHRGTCRFSEQTYLAQSPIGANFIWGALWGGEWRRSLTRTCSVSGALAEAKDGGNCSGSLRKSRSAALHPSYEFAVDLQLYVNF